MSISETLFSFEGRIGRGPFWAIVVPLMAVSVVVNVLVVIGGEQGGAGALLGLVAVVIGIAGTWIALATYVKRWHDLGMSGWMALTLFIPFVNIVVWLYLGLAPGTAGANKFGNAQGGKAPGDKMSGDEALQTATTLVIICLTAWLVISLLNWSVFTFKLVRLFDYRSLLRGISLVQMLLFLVPMVIFFFVFRSAQNGAGSKGVTTQSRDKALQTATAMVIICLITYLVISLSRWSVFTFELARISDYRSLFRGITLVQILLLSVPLAIFFFVFRSAQNDASSKGVMAQSSGKALQTATTLVVICLTAWLVISLLNWSVFTFKLVRISDYRWLFRGISLVNILLVSVPMIIFFLIFSSNPVPSFGRSGKTPSGQ